ncbi:MAG: inorganic diphosphatase, partial [Rubrobacteraceae bacterium]
DEKIICINLDDPEYMAFEHHGELPDHRVNELQRFFQDYKKLEDKEVNVGGMSGPEEAIDTVRRAMELYQKQFVAAR